jgi:manganese efflux pump family protein
MLALLLVSPLLGLDNFAAAASIGLSSSGWRTCVRVCVVFGAYAAVAPLLGLLLGQSMAATIGDSGRYLGGGVLIVVGLSRLISLYRSPTPARPGPASYTTKTLLGIGLAVSTDTLAAGFGLGLYGVPILVAVGLIAAATVLMSLVGFQLASRVGERLKTRADQVSSAALSLVGAALVTKLL